MRPAPEPHDPPDSEPHEGSAEAATADDTALRELLLQIGALTEYAQHFLSTRIDAFRLQAHGWVYSVAFGVMKLTAAIAISIASVVYLYRGMAGGFAKLFNEAWLGNLVTGLLGLGLMGAAVAIGAWQGSRKREARLVAKYEQRKSRQRARYGKDVEEAACVAA